MGHLVPSHVVDKMKRNKKGQFERTKELEVQKIITCSCGCRNKLDFLDSSGRPRKFIHGHNNVGNKHSQGRIPWNYGLTKEDPRVLRGIKKMSQSNKGKAPWNKGLKGAQKGWNKGLTKENSEIIKGSSEKRMGQVHSEKSKYPLDIHHVNYDKHLSIQENLITLCKPCHGKCGYNKKQWVSFFQSLLSDKYGYKYCEEGDVILEVEKCEN